MIKPILFNTDMVRAILDGRKTVTRQVVKPHYRDNEIGFNIITNANTGKYVCIEYFDEWENETRYMADPYRPGDILYVRETWCDPSGTGWPILYKADMPLKAADYKWTPSIHMPREAARIFLRVTDVRVERLQDMTEADAFAEGFEAIVCNHPCGIPCTDCMNTGYLEPAMVGFVDTWNSTIKPADRDLYGWEANPWVWVIEFERCEKP